VKKRPLGKNINNTDLQHFLENCYSHTQAVRRLCIPHADNFNHTTSAHCLDFEKWLFSGTRHLHHSTVEDYEQLSKNIASIVGLATMLKMTMKSPDLMNSTKSSSLMINHDIVYIIVTSTFCTGCLQVKTRQVVVVSYT